MLPVTLRLVNAASAALIIFVLGAETTSAALAPYFEGFDTIPPNGVPANFVETPDSAWSLSPGIYSGYAFASGGQAVSSTSISLTNVAGHNFTVRTTFTIYSYGLLDIRLADVTLVALADNSDLASGGYVLRWESAGGYDQHNKLFMSWAFGVAPTLSPPKGERQFTMILRGVYVNDSLHLTGTMSNGPKKVSVEGTAPTPLTGTYFGFRLSAAVGYPHVSGITVNIDNFSVTLD
jgi:hypothetical protein